MDAKTQAPTLKESSIVERVARIVSSVRGTKPDYTRLVAELEPAIPFDIFGVVLLRHDRQAVRVTVCRREAGSWIAQHHQHPLEDSKLQQLLAAPAMLVENYPDGLDGPPARSGDALSAYHQLHATLVAPLVVGDHVLGSLELGSAMPNTYADQTLQRLIGGVVRVLAAAIESAQVGGSVEIQDRQRQALKDVSRALTSKMDLPTILNQIVVGVARALNVASAIVMLDQREGKLRLETQSGLDAAILRKIIGRTAALTDQTIIGTTLRHRQPCVSHDIDADERFPESRPFATELAVRSIFSYPLVTGTTVYGALLLCSLEPGGFTPLKADILSLFASQATIAIHNGMLLASAQQRSRFQAAIEQLEQAHAEAFRADTTGYHDGDLYRDARSNSFTSDEYTLFQHVRQETEHTFGIRFSSLLHFISNHLLTSSEHDLQAILHAAQDVEVPLGVPLVDTLSLESTLLLTQTAEDALARADILSEVSRLLQLYERATGSINDAWFIVDLKGECIYMNPAAEVFCGMRMGTLTGRTLQNVFAQLMPRIRNIDEVRSYLQDFTQTVYGDTPDSHRSADDPNIAPNEQTQEMQSAIGMNGTSSQRALPTCRCVLAEEPVHTSSSAQPTTADGRRTPLLLDSAPSDHHYQLTRHPLHGERHGQLIANALQVDDITERVRDEKNKSVLLSSVSHDLRTPLTTIKAAVTGLLQPGVVWDEETRREILEEIDSETDHLTVLVNALVEMSRIEMGALVLEKEWCDTVEVVHGTLARLERLLAGRSVRTHFQPHLPLVHADHVQLERVFYNLIENAARHSPNTAEILVTLDSIDGMLCAQIIDYGVGVPESERERIFQTFYGLSSHGSGLGLAICKGIIEAHQGRIWVESAPGGGSCFIFTLPLHSYAVSISSHISFEPEE